jgi:hypothetical protein
VSKKHESFYGSLNVSMFPPPYALPNVANDAMTIMQIDRTNIQVCGE